MSSDEELVCCKKWLKWENLRVENKFHHADFSIVSFRRMVKAVYADISLYLCRKRKTANGKKPYIELAECLLPEDMVEYFEVVKVEEIPGQQRNAIKELTATPKGGFVQTGSMRRVQSGTIRFVAAR